MVLGAIMRPKSRPLATWGVLALFLASFAMAQDQGAYNSACFLGLNDADSPAVLSPCEAQDALNVESNLTGTAILKRKGYQLSFSLPVATSPVTGSHTFIDSSGNRQDIVCQDRLCLHSVNGNALSTFLSTAGSVGNFPSRWSFVDVGGILYGANDKRDPIMKYDGTTRSNPSGMPTGSILEMTQDRLAVGDITGQPNRVHFSSAGAYEQFTTGVNPEDSFFDDHGASGDRIRGIKCIAGNCFIFKSASITLCEMSDQYNTQCSVISPNVGTTDPASIVAAGTDLYFRAQDKNYWEIGTSGLRQISKKIPNLVKSQSGGLGGGEQSNTQTSKADWDAGTQSPTGTWDTSTLNGSIFPSSNTFITASASSLDGGTYGGTSRNASGILMATGIPRRIDLDYVANALPKNSNPAWTESIVSNGSAKVGGGLLTLTAPTSGCPNEARYYKSLTLSTTINHLIVFTASGTATGPNTSGAYVSFRDNGAANLWSGYYPAYGPTDTTVATFTIAITSNAKYGIWKNRVFQSTGSVSSPTTIAIAAWSRATPISGLCQGEAILTVSSVKYSEDVGDLAALINAGSDIPATSTYTYAAINSGQSQSVVGPLISTMTTNGGSNQFQFRSSADGATWGAWTNTSPGLAQSATAQYIQYRTLITPAVNLTSGTTISALSVAVASTGTFTTQSIQPNSSISAWGTLSCAETKTGNGSLVYYATSAASVALLPATDPTTWQTSVTNNATLSISTNAAVKIGFRSLLTSATDQAQVDSCILNWNEGTATQPSWAAYDSIKNAVYWTSAINGASSANRLLKYDRNLEQWYPFDISAQAPKLINNNLYFGGASAGTWNLYGSVDSDAGSAINAYWKSKDIGSDSPFQEKSFDRLSILSRNNGTGNMTATYTYSNAETGNYTVSLSTGSGIAYARSNFNLPITSPQVFMNVQVGNNSTTPFEVLGLGITWAILPWSVNP